MRSRGSHRGSRSRLHRSARRASPRVIDHPSGPQFTSSQAVVLLPSTRSKAHTRIAPSAPLGAEPTRI
jgi:hypothetical protein